MQFKRVIHLHSADLFTLVSTRSLRKMWQNISLMWKKKTQVLTYNIIHKSVHWEAGGNGVHYHLWSRLHIVWDVSHEIKNTFQPKLLSTFETCSSPTSSVYRCPKSPRFYETSWNISVYSNRISYNESHSLNPLFQLFMFFGGSVQVKVI